MTDRTPPQEPFRGEEELEHSSPHHAVPEDDYDYEPEPGPPHYATEVVMVEDDRDDT